MAEKNLDFIYLYKVIIIVQWKTALTACNSDRCGTSRWLRAGR